MINSSNYKKVKCLKIAEKIKIRNLKNKCPTKSDLLYELDFAFVSTENVLTYSAYILPISSRCPQLTVQLILKYKNRQEVLNTNLFSYSILKMSLVKSFFFLF